MMKVCVLKKASCRLLKKTQRRGARKSTSGGVLPVRRSEAIERQRSIWGFFSSLPGSTDEKPLLDSGSPAKLALNKNTAVQGAASKTVSSTNQ